MSVGMIVENDSYFVGRILSAHDGGAWRHAASAVPPLAPLHADLRYPSDDLMVPLLSSDAEALVLGNTLSQGPPAIVRARGSSGTESVRRPRTDPLPPPLRSCGYAAGGSGIACKCESFAVMMVAMPTQHKHPAPPPSQLPLRPVVLPPAGTVQALPQRPRWSSRTLLAGNREVEIEHDSVVYRLQLTSLGKLILTK